MHDLWPIALTFLAALVGGYGVFFAILRVLPYLEKRDNNSQRREVLKEAERQRLEILADARKQSNETAVLYLEELEADIKQAQEDLENEEGELAHQEAAADEEEARVLKFEQSLEAKRSEIQGLDVRVTEEQHKIQELRHSLVAGFEKTLNTQASVVREEMVKRLTDQRQLDCQKVIKSLMEELGLSGGKQAKRLLDRVNARYAPNFVWPKSSNVVEVSDEKTMALLASESCHVLADLMELSETTIQPLGNDDGKKHSPIIKFAGGFGVYREAARCTLEQLLTINPREWGNRTKSIYNNQRAQLLHQAELLGAKAVEKLHLHGIHPEIQKLIGALNWRTSYRQNQWHHTVEVAVLAGVLGDELGVDNDAAKRVGLLHDIGKAIDYRIDGSHAVISGDYADRYGESKIICDTVMSHHADLIVETPLAYILRAADTLSGARPGARVNLEEGYQIRLDAISDAVRSFPGIYDFAIMNGGREVHIQVNHKQVKESAVKSMAKDIATKIEENVAFPGQIKVMVSRSFESSAVA
jgi:ribonuclease Y